MTNQTIRIVYISLSEWNEEYTFSRAKKLCAELQKEINKRCPEGYKYKETISFEKDKDFHWIKAIVAYEQIPR